MLSVDVFCSSVCVYEKHSAENRAVPKTKQVCVCGAKHVLHECSKYTNEEMSSNI